MHKHRKFFRILFLFKCVPASNIFRLCKKDSFEIGKFIMNGENVFNDETFLIRNFFVNGALPQMAISWNNEQILDLTKNTSWHVIWSVNLLPCLVEHVYVKMQTHWRCELTPYSQRAHLNYLTGSCWGHLVSSQWTNKMSSHCELAVSLLWVCNSHSELTTATAATAWWTQWVISQIAHSKLTVWDAASQKAHRRLKVWGILWIHCEVTECPQNELSVSFNVSSQLVAVSSNSSLG